jgi:ketosteroid isomerase-like protein
VVVTTLPSPIAAKPAAPAPAPVAVAVAAPAKPAAPVVAVAPPPPPPVKVAAAAASAAVQLAKAEAPKVEPKAEPKPEPVKPAPDKGEQDDVRKAVDSWAKAWSAQDMKSYLSAYANNFQPPRGQTRQAWAADRSARIEGKEHIKVTVEAPQIAVNGNNATVKFRQQYVSDRLKSTSRKTLVLEKQGKQWLIKQEQSGS